MAERISADAPLSLADHRLVWALVAVVSRVHVAEAARAAMLRDELTRAVRQSDSRNSHVRILHECAAALLKAAPGSGEAVWARARSCQAIAEFAEWRMACALDKAEREGAA